MPKFSVQLPDISDVNFLQVDDDWSLQVARYIKGWEMADPHSRKTLKLRDYHPASEMRTVRGIYPILEGQPTAQPVVYQVLRLALHVARNSTEARRPIAASDLPVVRQLLTAIFCAEQLPVDIRDDPNFKDIMIILGLFHWELALNRAFAKMANATGLIDILAIAGVLDSQNVDAFIQSKMPVKEVSYWI